MPLPEPTDDRLDELDPFDLLGVDPQFDLDLPALARSTRRRVAALHPDRIADPIEQIEASRKIALLNRGRAVLENPESRANALLRRYGGPSAAEDSALPPSFLASIFEVREQLESALAAKDVAACAALETWARQERDTKITRVRALLGQLASHENVARTIRLELNAWRYVERMIEQLHPAARTSGPMSETR